MRARRASWAVLFLSDGRMQVASAHTVLASLHWQRAAGPESVSAEIPRPGIQCSQHMGHVVQPVCDQVLDAVDPFPLAVHGEQARADPFPALALGQITPDPDRKSTRLDSSQ